MKIKNIYYDDKLEQKYKGFTVSIPESIAKNPHLTSNDIGVLTYILSNRVGAKTNPWSLYESQVCKHFSKAMSPNQVRKAFKDLQKYGYLIKIPHVNKKGRFIKGSKWVVIKHPSKKETAKVLRKYNANMHKTDTHKMCKSDFTDSGITNLGITESGNTKLGNTNSGDLTSNMHQWNMHQKNMNQSNMHQQQQQKNSKSNKNTNQDSAVAVVDDKKHTDTSDSMAPNKKIDSLTKLDSSKENDNPTKVSQRNQPSRSKRICDPNDFNSFKSNKYGIQLPQNKQTYIWQLLHLDFPNLNLNNHTMTSITKWLPYSFKSIRFAVNYTFTQAQHIHILHPLSYIYWTLRHQPIQKGLNNETPYCSYVNRCIDKKDKYIHHIYETANTFEEFAKFNSDFKPYNEVYSPEQEMKTYSHCLQDMPTLDDRAHLMVIIKNFVLMHIRASSATGSLIEDAERTDSDCQITKSKNYTRVNSRYIRTFGDMENKGYQEMRAYRYIKQIVNKAMYHGKPTKQAYLTW